MENFKSKFGGNLNALLNQYKDSDDAASRMIDSEFFIKNILKAPCDSKHYPILPANKFTH
jgi:hypothetical protein